MKKMIFVIIFIVSLINSQCNKNESVSDDSSIEVTVKNIDTYEYKTGISGDEEGARVEIQAEHYEISKIVRDASTNWEAVYYYKPEGNYTGSDYVEIKTLQGSDGESSSTDSNIIKLFITVTQ